MNVAGSVFTGNTTSSQGGAIASNGGAATISLCDFNSNAASSHGGAIQVAGATNIASSTFRGNTSSGNGGAISAASTLTVDQCTFNKNTAAGSAGGGAIAGSTLTVNNSTIFDNTASSSSSSVGGGGVLVSSGTLTINSTIIAGNKLTGGGSTNGRDLFSSSTMSIAGNNSLIGTNDSSNVTLTGAYQAGTNASLLDPLLNSLSDNGGAILPDGNRIKTMSLQTNSPAINQGNNTLGFATDQRGSGYTRASGQADVGAFEVQSGTPPPPTATVTFGDGSNQRSMVKRIVVVFSESVNFSPNVASAFSLYRSGTGAPNDTVALTVNPATGPASSVTITFSGALTENGSLRDGIYDFMISAGVVSGAGGALDGNNDGIAGGSYSVVGSTANKYFRLFGDSDGSGQVDFLVDFIAFRNAFAGGGPNATFDFDNSNTVDFLNDFIAFRNRFNATP